MTSPDDDLAWRLKRELHTEAARLIPAQDGLSQIRAQLRSRAASPLWGGLRVDAERYGLHLRHLAAEAADWMVVQARRIPFPGRARGADDSAGRPARARAGMVWLRPVLAVAAVCIFAGTAAAVPGLRHAITNIGSSSTGSTTSVTGRGGGSGEGTGQKNPNGTNPGAHTGTTATATPSPSATCANAAKPVPSAKASPTQSEGSVVSPTVTPAQSSPAATPTTAPASPTVSPTTPTGSSDPTPTGTSAAPSGDGSGPTDSTHLTRLNPCPGPTLPGAAAVASASELPTAIPDPVQTSAQAYAPAATPSASITQPASTSSAAAGSTSSAAADGTASPSVTSRAGSGSAWSQGFATARGCRRHPHRGC